ncbi:hypothetical protein [uncultured Neptuniibacter sp.]|uniref:hypothetical protein n=1 Tax=uncultured Neptuniibacter sp. TaxID=502143 RepID=UPI002622D9A9|nr:hypothetical protein [uncultured Neptuniibacter sp.]
MNLPRSILLLLTLCLTACNSAGVKSDTSSASPQEIPSSVQTAQPDSSSQAQNKADVASPEEAAGQLELIANRMTAVQDHLLQIKSQSVKLQQQNQALAMQLQSLQTALGDYVSEADTSSPESVPQPDAFNGVLDQITMMANELSSQVQDGPFRITSTYTAKGQWVLIRYHRYSGETWLADKGQWNLLEESDSTGTAEYEVVVLRADKDVKGYVASRVNRLNGDSWWLKQDTWQPYLSN